MGKLIDADEFVEWLMSDAITDEQRKFAEQVKYAADRMKPAQRWIPCSERLPKNNGQVLVYARSVHYALAKYDEMREADGTYKKQWVTFDAWKPFYTIKDVLMWMPLPKPWEEEKAGGAATP